MNITRHAVQVQHLVSARRGLPGRSLFPHGLVQLDGRAQEEAEQAGTVAGQQHAQHHQELSARLRLVCRERNAAVRQHGAALAQKPVSECRQAGRESMRRTLRLQAPHDPHRQFDPLRRGGQRSSRLGQSGLARRWPRCAHASYRLRGEPFFFY